MRLGLLVGNNMQVFNVQSEFQLMNVISWALPYFLRLWKAEFLT